MKLSEVVFLVLVSGAALGFCLYGWLVESYAWTVILLPACLAAAIVALSTLCILRTLGIRPSHAEGAQLSDSWHQLRDSFGGLLWCFLALPILFLFGYPVGLALFGGLYVRTHGGNTLASVVFGCVVLAVVWVFAVETLGLPMTFLPRWWLS